MQQRPSPLKKISVPETAPGRAPAGCDRKAAILVFASCMAVIAQTVPPVQSATRIADLAVKNIDERYLYALSPQWKKASNKIAGAAAPDSDALYAMIRRQVATIRDSEVQMDTTSQLAI